MGYFASVILLSGQWLIGNKNKYGFLFLITGNLIWSGVAIHLKMYDLLIISGVNSIISGRNFYKWLREKS